MVFLKRNSVLIRLNIELVMEHKEDLFVMPDVEVLVRLYADDVLRVCNFYLGKRCQAEDAFQDVFIRVMNKKDSFAGNCPVKYWLLTIAKNICKDYLKSSWATRVGSYEQANEDTGESAESSSPGVAFDNQPVDGRAQEDEYFDSLDPEGELWDAIQDLPDPAKEVIMLRYYYDLDNEAIAKYLGITESTVRSRLFRARKKLSKFDVGG